MRFVDETTIYVKGGDGGRGCVSFLREKYRPMGGPNGGDGGDGGSVILVATRRAVTLLDLHFNRHYRAGRGEHGRGKDQHGAQGETIEVAVPLGTVVYDEETGAVIGDLVEDGQRLVVASGGMGGRGNARFTNSVRQAPDFAQPGIPGDKRTVRLELKLLADVGLIGLPNAGKSTLIRNMSRSRAKVADYPFTTLVPNLGVVPYDDDRAFVIADVPGLIAGAADGAGLGHQFLRHIERTRVLVHLLDAAGDVQPREAHDVLLGELERYDSSLLERPRLICLNKIDLVDQEWVELCIEDLRQSGCTDVIAMSALEGQGVRDLFAAIVAALEGRIADEF